MESASPNSGWMRFARLLCMVWVIVGGLSCGTGLMGMGEMEEIELLEEVDQEVHVCRQVDLRRREGGSEPQPATYTLWSARPTDRRQARSRFGPRLVSIIPMRC